MSKYQNKLNKSNKIVIESLPSVYKKNQNDIKYKKETEQIVSSPDSSIKEESSNFENDEFEEIDYNQIGEVDEDDYRLVEEDEQVDARKIWLDSSVKLLLTLYIQILPKVGKSIKLKNKKKMYVEIQRKMNENGYEFSISQIENKLRGLEKNYKRNLDNEKTGSDKICSYQNELEEIFKQKKRISEIYKYENESSIQNKDDSDNNGMDDLRDIHTNATKKASILDFLKEMQESRMAFIQMYETKLAEREIRRNNRARERIVREKLKYKQRQLREQVRNEREKEKLEILQQLLDKK